jgi:hypothetical protein
LEEGKKERKMEGRGKREEKIEGNEKENVKRNYERRNTEEDTGRK